VEPCGVGVTVSEGRSRDSPTVTGAPGVRTRDLVKGVTMYRVMRPGCWVKCLIFNADGIMTMHSWEFGLRGIKLARFRSKLEADSHPMRF